ncbi:hypothetical protein AA0119_g1158 [Alternaria tenuissima]|uniref:Uncharacterized protein n=1 Tax=Alternaria tenuissima TaxID=119927 RepID=A0AB37WU56_9PLEO|nr:hypothetical protein AA0115_g2137 [Alternaria tenuissima]RYN91774.1 hypothetical protein AA0120_g5279 [Alternaria tenuissima]RYO08601.1 hypothetical protein AA0119_g1158 [Alternaria tenuissima]RYO22203.1 hypothetical protein AA0121_g2562 [Alternaria tenuissima]
MHASTILLFASVALPILAVPVPTSNISPIPDVERRSDSHKSSWVIDFSRRAPAIDSVSPRASYDVVQMVRRYIGFPEGGSDTSSAVIARDSIVKRGKGVHWGGKRETEVVKDPLVQRGKGVHWGGKRETEVVKDSLEQRGKGVHWGGKRDSEPTPTFVKRGKGVHWGGKRDSEEPKEPVDSASGVR